MEPNRHVKLLITFHLFLPSNYWHSKNFTYKTSNSTMPTFIISASMKSDVVRVKERKRKWIVKYSGKQTKWKWESFPDQKNWNHCISFCMMNVMLEANFHWFFPFNYFISKRMEIISLGLMKGHIVVLITFLKFLSKAVKIIQKRII